MVDGMMAGCVGGILLMILSLFEVNIVEIRLRVCLHECGTVMSHTVHWLFY